MLLPAMKWKKCNRINHAVVSNFALVEWKIALSVSHARLVEFTELLEGHFRTETSC